MHLISQAQKLEYLENFMPRGFMSSSLATWHFFSNNMANIIWILLEATKLMFLDWDFERTLDMSAVQTAAPTFMLPGCPQTGYEFEF